MKSPNQVSPSSTGHFSNAPQQLHAHLFYKNAPDLPQEALLEALELRFGKVEAPNPKPRLRTFFFHGMLIPFKEGLSPAQCHLLLPEQQAIDLGRFETAKQQSFHLPDAFDVLKNCKTEVLVSDLLSVGLPVRDRVRLFGGFLRAVAEVAPPDVMYFLHSDRFESSAGFAGAEQMGDVLAGLVNVRMFQHTEAGENFYLMDTLGMHALGLPDFQVKFSGQEPGQIAARLYDFADYMFESGPVISNGDRVAGVNPDEPWTCQRAEATAGPERMVFDLQW